MTTTNAAGGSRLADKVAIITGGGSGFGAAIATRFAQEGAKVVVGDINVANAEAMAHAWGSSSASSSASGAGSVTAMKMDVTKLEDWEAVVAQTVGANGRVDILVNNAGTTYNNKPSVQVTADEFDRVFAVNVKSLYLASQTFIPKLLEQGTGGSMINISSTGAQRPRPGLVWYNSSKGAVSNRASHAQATKGLASEYGRHQIRVNNVCPLLSATGMFEMFTGGPDTPENRARFVADVPLGRLCETADVANMCLYLASEEARFVNGTDLVVDGGKCI